MDFKEKYFDVWQDAWAFHKKHVEESEEGTYFWEAAVYESSELLKKYVNKPQQSFFEISVDGCYVRIAKEREGWVKPPFFCRSLTDCPLNIFEYNMYTVSFFLNLALPC